MTENAVKLKRKGQSMSIFSTSPMKPIKDLMAMISNEVATAFFMGNLANKTKAGIIKKPPPAPTIPVKTPTTNPSNMMRG